MFIFLWLLMPGLLVVLCGWIFGLCLFVEWLRYRETFVAEPRWVSVWLTSWIFLVIGLTAALIPGVNFPGSVYIMPFVSSLFWIAAVPMFRRWKSGN